MSLVKWLNNVTKVCHLPNSWTTEQIWWPSNKKGRSSSGFGQKITLRASDLAGISSSCSNKNAFLCFSPLIWCQQIIRVLLKCLTSGWLVIKCKPTHYLRRWLVKRQPAQYPRWLVIRHMPVNVFGLARMKPTLDTKLSTGHKQISMDIDSPQTHWMESLFEHDYFSDWKIVCNDLIILGGEESSMHHFFLHITRINISPTSRQISEEWISPWSYCYCAESENCNHALSIMVVF